jgi:hypothetical protein
MNSREEIIMELLSISDHLMIELAGNEVNHENAGPERDEENNYILNASTFPASPHCMMN